MSFEETLVCDVCSRVIAGGARGQMIQALHADGGASFALFALGPWIRVEDGWRAQRHACAGCAEATEFYDGQPIPQKEPTDAIA